MTKSKVGTCEGCGLRRHRVALGLCWRCYDLLPVEIGRLLRASAEHLREAGARADERETAARRRALGRWRGPKPAPRQMPPEEDIYGWALATDGMAGE